MKYKVTYVYRGRITIDVEARDELEAEKLGMEEADDCVELTLWDVVVKEL